MALFAWFISKTKFIREFGFIFDYSFLLFPSLPCDIHMMCNRRVASPNASTPKREKRAQNQSKTMLIVLKLYSLGLTSRRGDFLLRPRVGSTPVNQISEALHVKTLFQCQNLLVSLVSNVLDANLAPNHISNCNMVRIRYRTISNLQIHFLTARLIR